MFLLRSNKYVIIVVDYILSDIVGYKHVYDAHRRKYKR